MALFLICSSQTLWANEFCQAKGVWVQVLGSAGTDLKRGRSGASYLIWIDGHARVLIDAGSGSAALFEESKAKFMDLDAVLLSNLHPDTWVDLPVLLRYSFYGNRRLDLPILAPAGNQWVMGSRETFEPWGQLQVKTIYPAELLASLPEPIQAYTPFRLALQEVPRTGNRAWNGFRNSRVDIKSMPVDFGHIPAVAWRVSALKQNVSATFAGTASGRSGAIEKLSQNDNLLVMHLGIEEGKRGRLRDVYALPSAIGRTASNAGVGTLLLGRRMGRTLGFETQTRKAVSANYEGSILFADDNDCFGLKGKEK